MKDKYVVVRSSESGVWMGILTDKKVSKKGVCSVSLTGARRAHYWAKGGDCSGLATHGPSGDGCRISPAVNVEVHGVCEILEASASAVEQWKSHGDWTDS